jgi:hypothetical protein
VPHHLSPRTPPDPDLRLPSSQSGNHTHLSHSDRFVIKMGYKPNVEAEPMFISISSQCSSDFCQRFMFHSHAYISYPNGSLEM